MQFHIETPRLLLREFRHEDVTGMFELNSDPRVMYYLGEKLHVTPEQSLEQIEYVRQQYADHGIGRWTAIEKASGEYIGWCGLKFITEPENNRTHFHDVGYRLIPRFWGNGYATESAKAALEYGFGTLQLQEIIGMCNEKNLASRRTLEKCGLTFVEKFQWNEFTCDWLRITKAEWNQNAK
jgi:[ribosomal protein S5]-alanine N-acetyltransferase